MRIWLHIGPDPLAADRLQRVLDTARADLATQGVLYPRSPGARNHTRLYMAITDPDDVDSLRHARGIETPERQLVLWDDVTRGLAEEVAKTRPQTMILSAHQFGTSLITPNAMHRLRALLTPLSDDIRILAHVDDPARMLIRRYGAQLREGRSRGLDLEQGLIGADSWWDAALSTHPVTDARIGQFGEVQGASHWLDLRRLEAEWNAVFGAGALHLRSIPRDFHTASAGGELRAAFDLGATPSAGAVRLPVPPAAAWQTRSRLFNDAMQRLLHARSDLDVPRPLWRKFLTDIKVAGDPIAPGSLSRLSDRFAADIRDLAARHAGLDPIAMAPEPATPDWIEADPKYGFRATQYLLAYLPRIRAANREASRDDPDQVAATPAPNAKTPASRKHAPASLPPHALQNLARLQSSAYAPHNRLGSIDETQHCTAYTPRPAQTLPPHSSGTIVVGCMKNEAPYVLEWIAHHRAIGVDHFLIYTNDCDDGTDAILNRLQALGLVTHRDNSQWTGKSPQQHALKLAQRETIIQQADWIIHIDVDEFINVRCDNGTLGDFLARVPGATNIAMTWRLFGHNGVAALADTPVIAQFDHCAPSFCPKPHTAWGFKTMFANIGAYGKFSCHRPNKLVPGYADKVHWVNGSGADMTAEARDRGWRNSRRSIGYDLLQLNHYALRSAEAFLIKRQRGRALHVDRSIGLNYWIRMDWSDVRDVTIQRNLPRMQGELDSLLADKMLHDLHRRGHDWHRAKAADLHDIAEFEDLYQQALALRLTATERVAYALALDMES